MFQKENEEEMELYTAELVSIFLLFLNLMTAKQGRKRREARRKIGLMTLTYVDFGSVWYGYPVM